MIGANRSVREVMLFFTSLLFVISSATALHAQQRKYDSPVRLALEPLSIRGRSGSPIPLQIKLEYNSPEILEGDLLLEIYDSVVSPEDLVATIRYEGIVLQGNDYFLRTVLPPVAHSYSQLYQVVGWFDTENQRYSVSRDPDNDDEPHDLLSVSRFNRSLLLCSVSGQRDFQKVAGNRKYLSQALRISRYLAADQPDARFGTQDFRSGSPQNSQRMQDYACSWDAYQLPEDPLHYCSFDVVLLADQALSRLEPSQLEALDRWVQAGGSLCVYPDDNRLTGRHLEYLVRWFERPSDPSTKLSLTDDGQLLVISAQTGVTVNRFHGLGRVSLLPVVDDASEQLDLKKLSATVGHLWKVRSDSPLYEGQQLQFPGLKSLLAQRGVRIEKSGPFVMVIEGTGATQRRTQYQSMDQVVSTYAFSFDPQPSPSTLAAACEIALMPEGVQMVPSSVIALLLVGYVITIGPIDYFVLGFFRVRKYTWILFPVVTAAFTVATVSIAHAYMASNDTGGRLSLIDLVEDGTPVRQTDLQMHFYGAQTSESEERKNSFVVPAQMQNMHSQLANRPVAVGTPLIHYAGRFPQAYRTTQSIRQWEPLLDRRMTLAPKPDFIPDIPWDDRSLVTGPAGRRRLAGLLSRAESADQQIDAVIVHQDQIMPVRSADAFLFSHSNIKAGQQWRFGSPWQAMRTSVTPPTQDEVLVAGVLNASAREGRGNFFSFVSQVSPEGSASLEDLPLLDSTDARQWLLIVAVRQDDHIRFYRRLYFEDRPIRTAASGAEIGEASL